MRTASITESLAQGVMGTPRQATDSRQSVANSWRGGVYKLYQQGLISWAECKQWQKGNWLRALAKRIGGQVTMQDAAILRRWFNEDNL